MTGVWMVTQASDNLDQGTVAVFVDQPSADAYAQAIPHYVFTEVVFVEWGSEVKV